MSKWVKRSIIRDPANGMTRRTFLKGAAMAATAVGAARMLSVGSPACAGDSDAGQPGLNILVIIADEMRAPSVFLPKAIRETQLPNITRLANEGVDFTNHHVASIACVASRATMLTGLYTHQTAMFGGNIGPDLNTGFPTYGTILRDVGYDTFWFGKWHLCFRNKYMCPPQPYEDYGFTAFRDPGTCPDPLGNPYEGLLGDPLIRQQFVDWLADRPANAPPWCATVSLVNPHDGSFFPNFTGEFEPQAPRLFSEIPANFESPDDRKAERKPRLQQRLADILTLLLGKMPDPGIDPIPWCRLLDIYTLTEKIVDFEIGCVLQALEQSPFAQNTVVIFTSDHGDYAGSHGLRGKTYAMYEESIVVPLIVKDPTGTWTAGRNATRRQLTSHVDLVPLLLTLATGNERWRDEPRFEHLSTRLSLAKILANPSAAGRPYVVHATDEPSLLASLGGFLGGGGPVEWGPLPDHIMGVIMADGKFAQYAYWQPGTPNPECEGMEFEGYDYRTKAGQLELHNSYGSNLPGDQELIEKGQRALDHAIENELEAPVPTYLRSAQEEALADWFHLYKEPGRDKPGGG